MQGSTESDVIADGEPGDTGAEFHHDTGALMPEDRRKIDHRVAGNTMPVAVTDTRGLHLDQTSPSRAGRA